MHSLVCFAHPGLYRCSLKANNEVFIWHGNLKDRLLSLPDATVFSSVNTGLREEIDFKEFAMDIYNVRITKFKALLGEDYKVQGKTCIICILNIMGENYN